MLILGDDTVNLVDLAVVQAGIGQQYDRTDLTVIANNYGTLPALSPAASVAVPEPTALTLAVLGLIGGATRRNRKFRSQRCRVS